MIGQQVLCTVRRTGKNALASDCDDMGVQLSIGRRTLLAATRRLKDGVPSENKKEDGLPLLTTRNLRHESDLDNFVNFQFRTRYVKFQPYSCIPLAFTYLYQEEVAGEGLTSLQRNKILHHTFL